LNNQIKREKITLSNPLQSTMIISIKSVFCFTLIAILGSCGSEELENPIPLQLNESYFVFVTDIEVPVAPKSYDGISFTSKWDDTFTDSEAAPDVYFKIKYKGAIAYKSTTAENTIHASYSPIKGGVFKSLTEKNAGQYIEGTSIRCYDLNARLDFQVLDEDGITDDQIGWVRVPFKDIKEGKNIRTSGAGITITFFTVNKKNNVNETLQQLGFI